MMVHPAPAAAADAAFMNCAKLWSAQVDSSGRREHQLTIVANAATTQACDVMVWY